MTDMEAELLDVITNLVAQHCERDEKGIVFSGYIGANADAIDVLCDAGIMEDLTEPPHLKAYTRARWARWKTGRYAIAAREQEGGR